MVYFLVLAGMAKKVFKTAAFNHSAIPPPSILTFAVFDFHCGFETTKNAGSRRRRGFWRDVVVSRRYLQQNFYGRDFSRRS